VFNVPEREFLRLALAARPDFSAMTRLARTALHYGKLRQLAGLHQADGLVAWRLLDERMDGVAPNIVRDSCQRHLDYLNGAGFRERWADSARRIGDALKERSIPHYYSGSPSYYGAWGMDPSCWPRAATGGCFTALSSDASALADILAPLGTTEVLSWCVTAVRPDGQRLWINLAPVSPTDCGDVTVSASWFEHVRLREVCGVELPLLPEEAALILRGSDVTYDVANLCPLSLGSLAHIACLCYQVETWALVDMLLREQQATGRDGLTSALRHIVWAFTLAQKVYGCFDADWLEGWRQKAGDDPPTRRVSALTDFHAAGELVTIRLDDPERILFDLRGREGVAERLADGVFEARQ
jgi:hypothetical protein